MSRTKRRIKKFLKKALPAAALIAGATALGRRRKNQANVEMDLPTSNMTDKPTMADVAGGTKSFKTYPDAIMRGGGGARIPDNLPITSANVQRNLVDPPLAGALRRIRAMDRTGTAGDIAGEAAMFKDGGKVVKTGDEPKKRKKKISIQIKGFGKARRG